MFQSNRSLRVRAVNPNRETHAGGQRRGRRFRFTHFLRDPKSIRSLTQRMIPCVCRRAGPALGPRKSQRDTRETRRCSSRELGEGYRVAALGGTQPLRGASQGEATVSRGRGFWRLRPVPCASIRSVPGSSVCDRHVLHSLPPSWLLSPWQRGCSGPLASWKRDIRPGGSNL